VPAWCRRQLRAPELRRTFTVRTPAVPSSGSASAAVRGVLASIGLEPGSIQVVDATYMGAHPAGPGGATRIVFSVGSSDQADAIVRSRCGLKGSGCTIFEVLSDREQAAHALLWPVYEAALVAGSVPPGPPVRGRCTRARARARTLIMMITSTVHLARFPGILALRGFFY
jgi:hypothetical protein